MEEDKSAKFGECVRCGGLTIDKSKLIRKWSGIREVFMCGGCSKRRVECHGRTV